MVICKSNYTIGAKGFVWKPKNLYSKRKTYPTKGKVFVAG